MATHPNLRWRTGLIGIMASVAVLTAMPAGADEQTAMEPLFAVPFVVEHHVVQTDADGTASASEPVTDYYGGSWIVSVRPDGSRLVVDFTRREVTEIRPAASTYSTLGFERLAELNRRLRSAGNATQAGPETTAAPKGPRQVGAVSAAAVQVQRLPDGEGAARSVRAAGASGQGVMRLMVTAGAGASPIEVWCDPRVKLSERARGAVTELEGDVLAGGDEAPTAPAAMLGAARGYAQGTFPVRTVRHVGAAGGTSTIEDVATRLESLERFQVDLVKVPDGYRRVPHPLEVMVAFVEEEATRARQPRAGQ
jgi:hypothetical protein